MSTEILYPGVKRQVREVDHSPPSSDEAKNECSYTSTPPIRLHGLDRDNFTFSVLRWKKHKFLQLCECCHKIKSLKHTKLLYTDVILHTESFIVFTTSVPLQENVYSVVFPPFTSNSATM